MKLSPVLLQAIALGITVSTLSMSCQQNDVNSGSVRTEKPKKQKENQPGPHNCPGCGMG